jgi:hypothetical protein
MSDFFNFYIRCFGNKIFFNLIDDSANLIDDSANLIGESSDFKAFDDKLNFGFLCACILINLMLTNYIYKMITDSFIQRILIILVGLKINLNKLSKSYLFIKDPPLMTINHSEHNYPNI